MSARHPSPSEWATELSSERPGLARFVLETLGDAYGRPVWQRRLDPVSELILTILTQNSADINAERAFEALRERWPAPPGTPETILLPEDERDARTDGWGGKGLRPGTAPGWAAIEAAPLPELTDVIRPGGLAPQKAPRLQAALRTIREANPHGGTGQAAYDLELLGDMPALEARDWLTRIPGIGPKTASIVLLFCFGLPLMPVDRHVERVSKRIGLLPGAATADEAHGLFLAILEPDQMHEGHVLLIRHGRLTCHARSPECRRCPVAPRCRHVSPTAP